MRVRAGSCSSEPNWRVQHARSCTKQHFRGLFWPFFHGFLGAFALGAGTLAISKTYCVFEKIPFLTSDMFTMAKIRDGSTYLDSHLCHNDYYAKDEQVSGQWVGNLARDFNLADKPVEAGDKSFEALRAGYRPDKQGERLTQRQNDTRKTTEEDALRALKRQRLYSGEKGKVITPAEVSDYLKKHPETSNRVALFDFQCSAQKSVSIMAVTFADDRLREAHEKASTLAFAELEQFAGRQTGNGKSRTLETTGNLVAAKFTHDASRELDAQLHSHFVVANVTRGQDGKLYALGEADMCRAIRYAGKIYQNEMAKSCLGLGYDIEIQRDAKGGVTGFEIAGVTSEIRERHSQRSAQLAKAIEDFENRLGYSPSVPEIHVLVTESRTLGRNAMHEISTPEVRAMQLERFSEEEREALDALHEKAVQKVTAAAAAPLQRPEDREAAAIHHAREHGFERTSVKPAHAVLADALNADLGRVDLERLKVELAKDSELVPLEGKELARRFTTRENLGREKWAVDNASQRQGTLKPFSSKSPVADLSAWTRANKGFELGEDQQDAVRHVLESADGVFGIRGLAGSGKTTMLQELSHQLGERDQQLLYLAPTASAVETLRKEGFERAMTVARYLSAAAKDPENFRGHVVLMDEAGLQSVKQGVEVQELATTLNQRLGLIGDTRQHVSVEAGDYLRLLEDHANLSTATLGRIQRQRSEVYRKAVESFAAGKTREGFARLDQMGSVLDAGADYLRSAAEAYLTHVRNGHPLNEVLAVAPTHSELDTLNASIRAGLKASGHIAGEEKPREVFVPHSWTSAQKRQAASYRPGDVLQFTPPSPSTHRLGARSLDALKRDEIALAEGSAKSGERVTVLAIDGKNLLLSNGARMNPWRDGTKVEPGKLEVLDLAEGDRLLIRANDPNAGLVNGQILTVAEVRDNGEVATREGQVIPAQFGRLAHGYAVTSHASQGKTVDHVVIAGDQLNARALYVASSRGRESAILFVPDKDRMKDSLKDSDIRPVAMDLATSNATRRKSLLDRHGKTKETFGTNKAAARRSSQQEH